MTVLMFGWEFPPHISGGLGTACFGLTQALAEEGFHVLFVVPKAYGDEPARSIDIINASKVKVPVEKKTISLSEKKTLLNKSHKRKVTVTKSTKEVTRVEVEAAITPYTSPESKEYRWSLEQWNYQFTDTPSETKTTEAQPEEPAFKFYTFSGSYGANLLDEVNQFAEVGSVLAKQHSFDVIHAHDWMTYPAGIAAKKASCKPLVIHVHATEFDRSGENANPAIFKIEKQGMEEADQVITVSEWTKKIVTTYYNIPKEKVEVVYNGVIPSHKENDISLPPVGAQIVTFLGRITHQKGPQYFVKAAQKVARVFPEAHFIVAGSGDLLPQMIEQVANLKLSKKFHFTGFLTAELIAKIWSMTHVYVMPSISEPFGITPLEAIQSKVPVIVSKQSGVSEVMPHAIKVDFWDVDALADGIANVLKHKSLSQTLTQNGSRAVQNLTWKKAAQKLKKLYHAFKTST